MAESETAMGFKPNRCYNLCYNMDCMEGMAQFQDGFFDLAVVDPPYFSGPERRGHYGSKVSRTGVRRHEYLISPAWMPLPTSGIRPKR